MSSNGRKLSELFAQGVSAFERRDYQRAYEFFVDCSVRSLKAASPPLTATNTRLFDGARDSYGMALNCVKKKPDIERNLEAEDEIVRLSATMMFRQPGGIRTESGSPDCDSCGKKMKRVEDCDARKLARASSIVGPKTVWRCDRCGTLVIRQE